MPLALAVCLLAITARAQEPSSAFQPFFRLGASLDYRDSNRWYGGLTASPSFTSNQALLGGQQKYEDAVNGTTTGPIIYVGNFGTLESGASYTNLGTPYDVGENRNDLDATAPLAQAYAFSNEQAMEDPNEAQLQSTIITIQGQLNLINQQLTFAVLQEDQSNDANFLAAMDQLQQSQLAATTLQNALSVGIVNSADATVTQNQFATQIAALDTQLRLLGETLLPFASTSSPPILFGYDDHSVAQSPVAVSEGYGPDPYALEDPTDIVEVPVGDDIRFADDTRTADDLHGNGDPGTVRVSGDVDGDGVIEAGEVVAIISDFGDLYTYNILFDRIDVAFSRDFTSLELMKQHILFGDATINTPGSGWRFDAFHNAWSAGFGEEVRGVFGVAPERVEVMDPSWRRDLAERARFSLYSAAGLRSLFVNDDFSFDARGSILGRAAVQQEIDHYVVGPQLGLGAVAEASMFRFEALALGLVGYGRVENRQQGTYGEEAIPGALNRAATTRSDFSSHRSDDEQAAWHGETRLTGSCQLAPNLRFDATWRWFVTGPIFDAPGSVVYSAPNYGFQQTSGSAEYGNDWFLGLSYTR